jgi:hypothetical protein
MNKKIFGMFICILLIATAVPAVDSLNYSKIISTEQNKPNNSTLQRLTYKDTALIFGRITNLRTEDEYITFQAVNIKVITFVPFSFNPIKSGEYFEILKEHIGFIGVSFILALTKAYTPDTPNIACITDSTFNRITVATADANIKWRDIAITTDNQAVSWRVYTGSGIAIDAWNHTNGAGLAEMIAGDYIQLQFNVTTPPTNVRVTFRYIPTNALLGTWTVNV